MPLESQSEITKFFYCSYLSGHFGIQKTYNTIINKFWWPKLLSDVKEHINSCLICNRVKHPHIKEGYMAINPWPYQPLKVISIDCIVKLLKTPRGYNNILVINDHFSKFIELYAVKYRTVKTASKYVTDNFLDCSIPLK